MDEETPTDSRTLILTAIDSTYNTKKFLELCLVIYHMEEPEYEEEIEVLLKDDDLIREISIVSTLKENTEDRLYYLDKDLSTGALQYKEKLEKRITGITIENLKRLSIILKRLNEEADIEL